MARERPRIPENFRTRRVRIRTIDAENLCLRSGRVGERTEDIENCPVTQSLPYRHNMAHGRVMGWGKQECNADLFDDLCLAHRINGKVHAQCGQHICGTAGTVTLRFPCFTTRIPAPAATSADAVLMLNVCVPSPPLPQVSTSVFPGGRTVTACRRITPANAAISSASSFIRRAVQKCPDLRLGSVTFHDSAHDLHSLFMIKVLPFDQF